MNDGDERDELMSFPLLNDVPGMVFSDDYYEDEGGDDGLCSWCGGDGYDECDDPIQCCAAHLSDGSCPCGACDGSGLAKDQRIW